MEEYKQFVKELFGSVSSGYDNENLRFFNTSAVSLVNMLQLKGNEEVIDIAAGTGQVSIKLAHELPNGNVTATDISDKMLEVIKQKALEQNISNLQTHESDMESLSFGPLFDIATCSFGIFFLKDMLKGLKKIYTNIKPGGKLGVTTFNENFLHPLNELFYTKLEDYGIKRSVSSWENMNTIKKTESLMLDAGFSNLELKKEQHGFFLPDSKAWWQVVMNAGMKAAFEQLPKEKRGLFIKEHLAEINDLTVNSGIWMDVEVIFAVGIKN